MRSVCTTVASARRAHRLARIAHRTTANTQHTHSECECAACATQRVLGFLHSGRWLALLWTWPTCCAATLYLLNRIHSLRHCTALVLSSHRLTRCGTLSCLCRARGLGRRDIHYSRRAGDRGRTLEMSRRGVGLGADGCLWDEVG